MTATVGFLGIGSMGKPMSQHILDLGHPLVVYDTNETAMQPLLDAGAVKGTSPKDVADKAEIVFICLPTLEIARAATLGPDGLVHGKKIRLYINTGTTGQAFSTEMAEGLAKAKIASMDAPISGGAQGAAEGTLSIMVSGPEAGFAEIEPILQKWGKSVVYISDTPGHAQTVKLANNLLSGVAFAATAEVMVMAAKAGLDPEKVLQVINHGSGRNSATLDKFPRHVLNRKFDFGGAVAILYKDMSLGIAEAEKLGVPTWVCGAAKQMWGYMKATGEGPNDLTHLVEHMERWAGTQIPKTRD